MNPNLTQEQKIAAIPVPAKPVLTGTQVKLAAARNDLSDVMRHHRALHTGAASLRVLIAMHRRQVLAAVENSVTAASGHVDNAGSDMILLARGQADLTSLETLLRVIEDSASYVEAVAIIDPIHAEIEALTAQDIQERLDLAGKVEKHKLAVENARAKALALAELDEEVIAAAAALGN